MGTDYINNTRNITHRIVLYCVCCKMTIQLCVVVTLSKFHFIVSTSQQKIWSPFLNQNSELFAFHRSSYCI